ncbi:MAG: glutamate formimidoyltransferase [Cyanobacteria bacterium PR.023]|nr:glutamate formimidoyltransferase [Cyanobacteria bacterium DS2.008]MBA4076242.1 glutamate formimidoyltransferase [Cyanobacteria bacterium PR.023]
MQLVECVPNFSEGRNEKVIDAIADAIRGVSGVSLLDVDPGYSTNRTVVTFVGQPEQVVEAAYQAISKASQLIDMRKHQGEHPRMGATDVCPFVPVSGITMEQCVQLANTLGERVGRDLGIPIYLYGEAAKKAERRSLADIRQGEYEALNEKMKDSGFRPDFGPSAFNAASGATVIGARQFLIAYNVNLNTRSKKLANEIAFNIREAGRAKRNAEGEIEKDASGNTIKVPGTLKEVRAVGWYVDEYQRAQVSINLTNFEVTSLHQAFDEVVRQAELLGLRVTGSEIVGLVPLAPMLEAGQHYLRKQGRSTGVSEAEIVECAIQSLGLAELSPFVAKEKIIEYRVAPEGKFLRDMTLTKFVDELASESPAPGGGSVAALCGSLSAALSAMVANLTFDKKGFEDKKAMMEGVGRDAQRLKQWMLQTVDDDMQAFNRIIDARRMAKGSESEKALRDAAILEASKAATLTPLSVLQGAPVLLELAARVVEHGNPSSLSDGAVAALVAAAAAEGAYYNVLINLRDFGQSSAEQEFVSDTRGQADKLIAVVRSRAEEIKQLAMAALS